MRRVISALYVLFQGLKTNKMELKRKSGKEEAVSQVVTKTERKITPEERLRRKDEILGILARSAEEEGFISHFSGNPVDGPSEYYTMTSEELAALAAGDIEKIEAWAEKLDSKHATWLMARLCQASW